MTVDEAGQGSQATCVNNDCGVAGCRATDNGANVLTDNVQGFELVVGTGNPDTADDGVSRAG